MGRVVIKDQPCPVHGGSDSVQIYEDGSAYCFNGDCKYHWGPGSYNFDTGELVQRRGKKPLPKYDEEYDIDDTPKKSNKDVSIARKIFEGYKSRYYNRRHIEKKVLEHYKCRISTDEDGEQEAVYYAYNVQDGIPQGYKKRILPKDFSQGSVGQVRGLFGWETANKGKILVITEGEDDAMMIQQGWWNKYNRFYSVVSLRSSTGTKDLIEVREQIRKFDEVVLWFDNDDAGHKATKEAAKIIGYDKVKVVSTTFNDACEAYEKLQSTDELIAIIYDAKEYSPASILNGDTLWERLVNYNEKESVPYPPFMDGLNEKLKGMRFGEITLWTSGTGSGKSTLMREIVHHLVTGHNPETGEVYVDKDRRIGLVSLEESPEETSRKLAGMNINRNPSYEEIPLEELKEGFDNVFGDGNILVLDHQGAIGDGSIMDQLEYMCLKGCKYLFVDHITILVSEGAEGLSGNEAIDKVMNDMLRLVKKYDVWLGLISHLRKSNNDQKSFEQGKIPSLDDIKGSGSIKQISFDVIGFARNQESDSEEERNTVNTKVLKCRYTGLTGPSGAFKYEHEIGRMKKGDDSFAIGGKFMEVES